MGRNEPNSKEQLVQFERRLLSIFEDRTGDQEAMARSERRLRQAMVTAKPARRWRSTVAGVMAVMVAGLGIALVTAAVHGGLIHLGSTASTAKTKPAVKTSLGTPTPERSCQLPVRTDTAQGLDTGHGFVNFPDGTYVADRSVPGRNATYDAPLKRWIPFSLKVSLQTFQTLSPDGRTFVYVSGSPVGPGPYHGETAIHLVDLVGGEGDRVIWKNAKDDATILGYSELGVVFMVNARPTPVGTRGDADPAALGHWLLNPADGSLKKISMPQGPSYPEVAVGTSFWTTRFPNNQLVRIDLRTGAEEAWQDMRRFEPASGAAGQLLGFDSQYHPVYRFGSRDPGVAYKVVLLSAPDQPAVIYSGQQGDPTGFDPTEAIGDAHGIWFGNFLNSAVWLYHAGKLERIPVHGLPHGSADIIDLVGSCS